MTPKISKEENARRVAESRESRHLQRKAAMAATLQRRTEEKQRRLAARQTAKVASPPPPLSVCPWESGAVEPVLYGGVM